MTEREQFEAWAKKAGWPHHFTSCNTKDPNAYSQESWEAWQARAQTAQAVPASCGECGKKTIDGWALYCVACMEKAGLPAQAVPPSHLIDPSAVVSFAVDRWLAEVANRPLVNVHRRTLDDTWRQVIRRFGGDPDVLLGPPHDELVAIAQQKGQP